MYKILSFRRDALLGFKILPYKQRDPVGVVAGEGGSCRPGVGEVIT